MTLVIDKPFTDLQLELLRLYSREIPEDQLIEIKNLLANYFAHKATEEMDKLWVEKGWTNETMREWLKGEEE